MMVKCILVAGLLVAFPGQAGAPILSWGEDSDAKAETSSLTCTEWLGNRQGKAGTHRLALPEMSYLIQQLGVVRATAVGESIDKACEAYPWMLWVHAARMVLRGERPPSR